MKARSRCVLAAFGLVLLALALLFATGPAQRTALLRVVDPSGKPVSGAVITPQGLRSKPGPYKSGWFMWRPERHGAATPRTTDRDGYARVAYPRYVFERIETGVLCLSVDHADFVPARPECVMDTAPSLGAPWRLWLDYIVSRIQHKTLVVHPDPIVLQPGSILKLAVRLNELPPGSSQGTLVAQVSGIETDVTNLWIRPEPGTLLTRRLQAGMQVLRAIQIASNGVAWFTEVTNVTLAPGITNELTLALQPGYAVNGRLDSSVPRPVRNGRVIAHVWPTGCQPQSNPPQWHAWAPVQSDGTFSLVCLPKGDLEVLAICDGFVSTNGPGRFKMRYPQKHMLGADNLEIVIGMEPTARIEARVTDERGRPLKNAQVMTWPNARYGEWAAVILGADCYNMSDLLLNKPPRVPPMMQMMPDLTGTTDSNGLAILPNVPADVKELTIIHDKYELPAVSGPGGDKSRQVSLMLRAGETNFFAYKLQPSGKSPIRQY